MPVVKNGCVIFVQIPTGHVEPGVHTKYIEGTIDLDNVPLHGGVLVKTLVLSSDPYLVYRMREENISMFCPPIALNQPVDNLGVAKIIRSENPKFQPGDYVSGYFDYSEYSVYPGKNPHPFKWPMRKLDKNPAIPWSYYTGTLGLAGMAAYSGFKVLASEKAKTSKTMFVSSGGGPIGLFVIEYAKIINPKLKIIASAGTEKKVQWMKDSGADVVFNYKTTDAAQILKEHGPIDLHWDNVAGPTLDAVLDNINNFGLIVACGAISQAAGGNGVIKHFEQIFMRSLTVQGFICFTGPSAAALPGFFDEVVPLVLEKKISVREQHYAGLQAAGDAIRDMHTGGNNGKAVIVVADD